MVLTYFIDLEMWEFQNSWKECPKNDCYCLFYIHGDGNVNGDDSGDDDHDINGDFESDHKVDDDVDENPNNQ